MVKRRVVISVGGGNSKVQNALGAGFVVEALVGMGAVAYGIASATSMSVALWIVFGLLNLAVVILRRTLASDPHPSSMWIVWWVGNFIAGGAIVFVADGLAAKSSILALLVAVALAPVLFFDLWKQAFWFMGFKRNA